MSTSNNYRQQGNAIYSQLSDDLSPVVWESRANTALSHYHNAFTTADNSGHRSSAAKNYSVLSSRFARFHEAGKLAPINSKLVIYYYREAVLYFGTAYKEGYQNKSVEWLTDVKNRTGTVLQEFYQYALSVDIGQARVRIMKDILEVIDDDFYKGECYTEIGKVYLKEAFIAIEKDNFCSAISCLKECYRPIEEAKACGTRSQSEHILSEARILEEDTVLQMCIAEALQARFIGDDLLSKCLTNYESLPIHLVWDIMDWYKKSLLLAQEKEIEIEAVAYSRIGKVYHRVLKLEMTGKAAYKKSLDLAASVHPRTFNTEGLDTIKPFYTEWYKECATSLAEIQKESVLEEEKRKEETRKVTIDQLKEEIAELNDHSDVADDLLSFVYKRFPPKNSKHVLAEDYETRTKKVLCLAIQHYHPDKISVAEHGIKWKVLCEEITKRLTNRYECYKGVD